MRTGVALAVVLVLLVAGCTGGSTGGGQVETEETPETPSPAETAAPTTTPNPTTTTEPPPENPWGKEPVVVGVRHHGDADRVYTPLVRDAVRYWETEGARYATWEPAFSVEPNASDPDVVVSFQSSIDRCELDHPGRVVGCASVLRPNSRPEDPEVIEVVTGHTNYVTRETVKHEFGHLLGLVHGDEPVDVMDEPFVPFSKSRPNATYHVSIEYPGSYAGERTSRRQVRHALDYYEAGAEGWMDGSATFEVTSDRAEADVAIVVTKRSPAGSEADFRAGTIYLNGLLPTRHAWHVGYWLGFLFGATDVDDLPPAFDEPQVDDREDWW